MSQSLHRRTVLKCLVAAAASTAFGCHEDEPPVEDGRTHFPQSVASGDPRALSVVLWTRAVDPALPDADLALTLLVARDEAFEHLVLEETGLLASAAHDHTLQVKVTRLEPRTRYYYRFVVEKEGKRLGSPVGRTRTAPAYDAKTPVRFAVANCQDFRGRYYNSWHRLLQLDEDLDFVLFVGDYVYESDSSAVPSPDPARVVRFSDPGSALPRDLGGGRGELVAQSLSNYRDLYRTYRSDPFLQKVHERYPFIVVWDDHEFSNDCWDAHATYTDGRTEEFQPERRRNAELAFFEYMPLDTDAGAGVIDPEELPRYPDTRIYRDFIFGKHLRLFVTDYRTYRPDHLIPEDAYPATVAMDAAVLASLGLTGAFAADAFAYVNIDEFPAQRAVLRGAYVQLAVGGGLTAEEASMRAELLVKGNLALAYANPVLQAAAQPGAGPIGPAGKPRGLAFVHMGKQDLFSSIGARNVVIKDTFDVYAAWRYSTSGGEAQHALGKDQEAWLLAQLREGVSPQTWKVMASSVSTTSMIWDLRAKPDVEPPSVRNRYYFSVDQWDGFPDKRSSLMAELRERTDGHALVVAGDIHAAFASVEQGVPCLTAPAIASSAVQEEAGAAVEAAGFPPGSAVYRYVVTEQAATFREGNPGIAFVDTNAHGFTVVEVGPEEVKAAYHLIPSSEVDVDYGSRPGDLAASFSRSDFRVRPGGTIDAA
ncbi:metallophosphatase [Archangium sp. Cb G35]|uniref:alkaline phosphatase D family protein n=1 Tax=Archangium sp. Cb G35 TaxID=1920190 RepID=UPI0009367A47|nr:alkaline phosphatase D family protein [Archangium sp. Cb G35]OJT25590.1 metallophosphatase [Archangium sp. Cb G35]